MANQIGYDRYPQLTQSRGQIVPVSGTGDNGYRPNFTTPTPQETRWANQRGDALRRQAFTAPPDTNPKLQTATSPEAAAWQRETAARPGPTAAAPKPPITDQLRQGAAKYVADRRTTAAAKPAGFVMGRALPAAGAVASGYNALEQAADGNYGEAAWSAADATATLGLANPVTAPVAGAYLAGSGAVRGVRAANEYIANNRDLGDAIGGTINGVLRRFGGGVDDSAYLQMRAQERMDAARPTAPRAAGTTPSARPQAQGQAQNAPQNWPTAPTASSQPPGGMTGNVTRNGNEYSGTNVGGDITINGFAPGAGLSRGSIISPQNMAAADGLAAQQERASLGRVAAQQSQQPLRQFSAPTAVHSGNDWTARQRLRSLEMRANGIYRTGKERHQAQAAYLDALRADAGAMGSQPTLQAETNRTNASMANAQTAADASRYNSDNSLRGTMYNADSRERGDMASAASTAATAAMKYRSDAAAKAEDRAAKNMDRAREQFTIYDKEGKPDNRATQSFMRNLNKTIPGYATMSETERLQYEPQVLAMQEIYQRGREQRTDSVWDAVTGNDAPVLDTMPNYQGGQLRTQYLGGLLPGGAGWGGKVVDMPDGTTRVLGDVRNENTLNTLRRNMATGGY